MIRLTLPYPISTNRYWRTYVPRGHKLPVTVVSQEAKIYKNTIRKIALQAGARLITGRVNIDYVLYPHLPKDWKRRQKLNPDSWDDSVQCIDLDNAQKVLFDSLEGIAFENDKLIRRINGERAMPDGMERVEIIVTPYSRNTGSLNLFSEGKL